MIMIRIFTKIRKTSHFWKTGPCEKRSGNGQNSVVYICMLHIPAFFFCILSETSMYLHLFPNACFCFISVTFCFRNPLVSFDVMEKRLQGRRLIKMSFMKNFMQKGDIEGDWVTIGVVVKKVPPKTSKNVWKSFCCLNIFGLCVFNINMYEISSFYMPFSVWFCYQLSTQS